MGNSRKKVNTDSQVVMKKMNALDCLLSEVGLLQLYIKPYFWKRLHIQSHSKSGPQMKDVAKKISPLFVCDIYIWSTVFLVGI